MSNPLLEPFEYPPFAKIKTEDFLPAIQKSIEDARKDLNALTENSEKPTFTNTIEMLENIGEKSSLISSILFNLNSAETNQEIQKVTQKVSELLTIFNTEIVQNEKLFLRIKYVFENENKNELSTEQLTLLEKTFKRFVRNGANLNSEDKNKLKEISIQLSQLTLQFQENVLKETNSFQLHIENKKEIEGIPENVLKSAQQLAEQQNKKGWIFTLHIPCYLPIMEYANNRSLREKMFKAYMSKSFKDNENDNKNNILKIIQLRAQKAQLLGYKTYAEYVLEERMAKNPKEVYNFLDDLFSIAKPKAIEEVEEIKKFMNSLGITHNLERWDWAYFSKKLKKQKFDFDDELIKPYFSLEKVIDGVFKTANKLFGLSFVETKNIEVYHPDVKVYEVKDSKGELTALFYADFFPRKGKQAGAWMTSFRNEKKVNNKRIIPQISIVCNFSPSTKEKPSLLKFDEVTTLFHEFGHALHGMLANTTYESLSGTSVYWDFVELPSQIFENWCYEKECLDLFATHFKTQESIPIKFIESIKSASNFQEAYNTLRQLSFAFLDLAYHHLTLDETQNISGIADFERKVMEKFDLFPNVPNTNMSVQFSHIFAGGYAAGYYSYKWAEVLDADAFELFKEKGIFNTEVSKSFKDNILSKGGIEHPMELYKKFRGQAPQQKALLKRAGLLK